MFPLPTHTFPQTVSDLAGLMTESVRRAFRASGQPITIESASYPSLKTLRINLDHAFLRPDAPPPPAIVGSLAPAFEIENLLLEGACVSLGPLVADVHLSAREIGLDQGRDAKNEIVLALRSASEGQLEIATDKAELEKAILVLATHEAAKQGVAIEKVDLTLNAKGPRSLSAEIRVKAKKLFFTTVIRIAASLDLDEQLNATPSGLACEGEGAIGSLACGALGPHLKKFEGRAFSLLALSLGDIRIRDVRLSITDRIVVQAEFGA